MSSAAYKVSDDQLLSAWDFPRSSVRQIGERIGLSERQTQRRAHRLGLKTSVSNASMSEAQKRRLLTLAREGMPMTWIIEDIGRFWGPAYRLGVTVPNRKEAVLEWQRTWASIRHDERLLALHREFAPHDTKYRSKAVVRDGPPSRS